MKRRLSIAVAAAVFVSLPAPAEAAPLRFEKCDESGFSCARLEVPLDRTGKVPGRVSLFVKRRPSTEKPSRGVLIAFGGGPGQSATNAFLGEGVGAIAAARTRDLVIYDQRGTGRSGLLRCPGLERASILHGGDEAADCAERLGRRRAFYTSRDTAGDVEALRRRLGVAKVSLYGVSYGTRTALAYAQRYPNRVDRLVLDSVVDPGGVDALYRSTFAAVPRVLGTLCRPGCDSFTDDPIDDLRALVARMAGGPLRGTRIDFAGRRRPAAISSFDLLSVLASGDFAKALRAAFPGAVRSAREGDSTPLLRLAHRGLEFEGGPFDPRALSVAVYAATSCEEMDLPWKRGAPFGDRASQAQATVDAIPESAFVPFDRSTAASSDFVELCGRWPEARKEQPLGLGALPDVPTLILNGGDDLRTPLESARAVAALLPRSRLLAVPGVGHSALSADPTGCTRRAYTAFLDGVGKLPKRCRGVREITPDPKPPRTLREVTPAAGVGGRRGRVVTAVALTLGDVAESIRYIPYGRTRNTNAEGGGLRGGSFTLWLDSRLDLRGVAYVPGVRVFGRLARFGERQRGTVRIDGPKGADGVLRLSGRRFSGRIADRRVSGTFEGSASSPANAATRPHPVALPR